MQFLWKNDKNKLIEEAFGMIASAATGVQKMQIHSKYFALFLSMFRSPYGSRAVRSNDSVDIREIRSAEYDAKNGQRFFVVLLFVCPVQTCEDDRLKTAWTTDWRCLGSRTLSYAA